MTTASITHRQLPLSVGIAAFVVAAAFTGVAVSQHDFGSPARSSVPTAQVVLPNPDSHYQRPMHSGVQPGMP